MERSKKIKAQTGTGTRADSIVQKAASFLSRFRAPEPERQPGEDLASDSTYRILYLIWSVDLGGAEQVVMNLAKRLDRSLFEPVVCCLNDKGRYAYELEEAGIKVIALRKLPKVDPFLIPRLLWVLKKYRIDLIHSHLFSANLWARMAGRLGSVPVVASEHGMDKWRQPHHLMMDRRLLDCCERVICVSQKVKDFYSKRIPGFEKKAAVIYNGVDTSRFRPDKTMDLRDKMGISSDPKVLGTVGRLVPEKSQVDFIEAVSVLKEEGRVVLGMLVGDGPLRLQLEKRVRESGLEDNVRFVGFSSDLLPYYHTMDVFVLSSLQEGLPMTLLEAMACGVPVVATDVGGIGECIKNEEDGLLVPPGDTAALAQAVMRVLDDGDLRQRLRTNAREKVCSMFSVNRMTAEHEALYREILDAY